jgi:hypothetical protein
MGKQFTITLTDRAPVRVDVDDWIVVAQSKDSDGIRSWKLVVRECQREQDIRCIVYGVMTTNVTTEKERRGGFIVPSIIQAADAIIRVAEHLGFNRELADNCIAELPAQTL